MAGEINVNTQKLRDGASVISNKNKSMRTQLDTILNKMRSLNSSWESEAANAIMKKFEAKAGRSFESYSEALEAYAKALLNAADTYENKEGALTSNAESFN